MVFPLAKPKPPKRFYFHKLSSFSPACRRAVPRSPCNKSNRRMPPSAVADGPQPPRYRPQGRPATTPPIGPTFPTSSTGSAQAPRRPRPQTLETKRGTTVTARLRQSSSVTRVRARTAAKEIKDQPPRLLFTVTSGAAKQQRPFLARMARKASWPVPGRRRRRRRAPEPRAVPRGPMLPLEACGFCV